MDTGYPALIADLPDKQNDTERSTITGAANSKEPALTPTTTNPIDTPPIIQHAP